MLSSHLSSVWVLLCVWRAPQSGVEHLSLLHLRSSRACAEIAEAVLGKLEGDSITRVELCAVTVEKLSPVSIFPTIIQCQ